MLHKDATRSDGIHTVIAWQVADAAALAALTLAEEDIGKIAFQVDTSEYMILEEDVGPTWRVFAMALPGYSIPADTDILNWNDAYSWGDHTGLYVDLISNQNIDGTKTFIDPIVGDLTGNADTATSAASATVATSATTSTHIAGGVANEIPYQTGAGATDFIPAPGVDGHVLARVAGALAWTAPAAGSAAVKFRAYRSASYNFANAAYTKVQLNAESFDSDGYFDSTTNYRFTPLVAGYYFFAWLVHGGNTNQGVASQLRVNGASVAEGTYYARDGTTGRSAGSEFVYLNGSTDYVELYGYISSAGTPSLVGGATETKLVGFLVH
jgi:hypothetical protein